MERTLAWLRDHGWTPTVVERFIPERGVRVDAFGCDVLAAKPGTGILLVQACAADFAAHLAKLTANPDAATFVAAGGEVELIGWRELRATGWTPRVWRWSLGRELELEEALAGVPWQPELIRSTGGARRASSRVNRAAWGACGEAS